MKKTFIPFAIIGTLNTAIDVFIYAILRSAGLTLWPANALSTAAALLFSFLMNRRFTFKAADDKAQKQFLLFLPVTLVGMWILSPLLIYAFTLLDNSIHFTDPIHEVIPHLDAQTVVPKLLATGGTLVWNFMWYSQLVFKKSAVPTDQE